MSPEAVGLPEALERAASAMRVHADAIRPANGDPTQLVQLLGPEAGAAVLTWLLGHEPEAGGELATAWAEDPEVGGPALLRVQLDGLPKAGQKALRRAHHRLRSHGLELPAKSPEARVAKLPPIDDELAAALISPIDPSGTRVAYLVERHPGGGARLFEVMLDDERGVLGLEVYNAGRSQVRRFLRDVSQRKKFPAVAAPPEAVRALIGRIAAEQPAARPLPRVFTEWRSRVAVAPEGTSTPGELARAGLGADASGERIARAVELVREQELGPWPPPSEGLAPVAEELGALVDGQIIVSGARRREQVDRVLEQAVTRIFGDAFAACTARRFEESAYVLWRAGREDDARASLAAAESLRGEVAPDHVVARALLEVIFTPVLERIEAGEKESAEEPSLLVKP